MGGLVKSVFGGGGSKSKSQQAVPKPPTYPVPPTLPAPPTIPKITIAPPPVLPGPPSLQATRQVPLSETFSQFLGQEAQLPNLESFASRVNTGFRKQLEEAFPGTLAAAAQSKNLVDQLLSGVPSADTQAFAQRQLAERNLAAGLPATSESARFGEAASYGKLSSELQAQGMAAVPGVMQMAQALSPQQAQNYLFSSGQVRAENLQAAIDAANVANQNALNAYSVQVANLERPYQTDVANQLRGYQVDIQNVMNPYQVQVANIERPYQAQVSQLDKDYAARVAEIQRQNAEATAQTQQNAGLFGGIGGILGGVGGALLGSVVPGIGTAVGAGLGSSLGGAIGSYGAGGSFAPTTLAGSFGSLAGGFAPSLFSGGGGMTRATPSAFSSPTSYTTPNFQALTSPFTMQSMQSGYYNPYAYRSSTP